MKRRDVIRRIQARGGYLQRSGANHDIYAADIEGGKVIAPVARHTEIDPFIVKAIEKQLGPAFGEGWLTQGGT